MAEDDEKQEALKEESRDVDGAAIARSRAVSQGVREAQLHQQQAQPSVVRWERFLTQQQLHVLLVEDDDSTGHVVTALLRNCSYEVTFAANGLLAWELLMDQSNRVDLVLTEVVMPGLSGIGLLTRIMNHETLKHIPVIMMSSHDSMGVVFKCLSKGAVDFLVKPVRKNELKNLWQHIWRRCHSSSGSGSSSASGSGSPTQKVAQPDTAVDANNSGSNDESDNMSSELNLEGGSDNGSGTQSSWTKKAVEVESSHPGIPGNLNLHSSIQSKNGCLLEADNKKDNDVSLNTNLEGSRVTVTELPFFQNDLLNLNSTPNMIRTTGPKARDTRQLDEGFDRTRQCVNQQMANVVNEILIKEQESADEEHADSEDADDLLEKHASNSPSSKDQTLSDSSSPSLLKLSLKRPSQAENDKEGEVRGALKRSCSSAFSRYNIGGNNTPLPAATISTKINLPASVLRDDSFVHGSSVGSSHPLSIPFSSRIDRPPFQNVGTDEVMASPFFRGILHGSSNQNSCLAHTFLPGKHGVASCFVKEEGTHFNAGPGTQMHFSPSPGMPTASGSRKEPLLGDPNLAPHWRPSSENVEVQELHVTHKPSQAHLSAHTNQDAQVHHHSHHHHHHHHHHIQHHYRHHQDQPQQRPQTPQQEDSTVMSVGASVPNCGSSKMEKDPEGNNGQSGSCNGYGSNGNGAVSLNGSATGSNYGSNGGLSAGAEPAGVGNVDSTTQLGPGSGLTAAQGFLLGPDESRHARREAALTKFRQKRKERCFEKKVRYQSRKRLAEQRPRVRGQFVRQSVK